MKADIIGEEGFLPWPGLVPLEDPFMTGLEPLILGASILTALSLITRL